MNNEATASDVATTSHRDRCDPAMSSSHNTEAEYSIDKFRKSVCNLIWKRGRTGVDIVPDNTASLMSSQAGHVAWGTHKH